MNQSGTIWRKWAWEFETRTKKCLPSPLRWTVLAIAHRIPILVWVLALLPNWPLSKVSWLLSLSLGLPTSTCLAVESAYTVPALEEYSVHKIRCLVPCLKCQHAKQGIINVSMYLKSNHLSSLRVYKMASCNWCYLTFTKIQYWVGLVFGSLYQCKPGL